MSEDSRKDLPPVTAPNFLEKVREALSVYLGSRGSGLDRGVTLRDLTDAGLVQLRAGFSSGNTRNPIGGPGTLITESTGAVYEVDLSPPPTPTGFAAVAAISNLLIECDAQTYPQGHGHAKSKLYGATWVSGALPVFANAVVITEFVGDVASHATNPATTWHLWLTWVTADGVESSVPAGGTNGVVVTTGQDVTTLLTALTGKITASELYASLGDRINLIDGAVGLTNSVAYRVAQEASDRAAAVLAEATARGAAISSEASTRESGDNALATSISLLTAGVAGGFDVGQSWYFDSNVESWTSSGGTQSWNAGYVDLVSTGTDPQFLSPTISVSGAAYSVIKARVKRLAGSGWDGTAYYSTSGHGLNGSYKKTLSTPGSFAIGETIVLEWDMSTLTAGGTDWVSNTITQIRLDIGSTATDQFSVDWVAVGRNAPGASQAGLLNEQIARIAADSAEVTSRQALATKVTGAADPSSLTLATIASGLLYDEKSARSTADSTEVTARQLLSSTVLGATDASGKTLANVTSGILYDEKTARASADSAQVSATTSLSARVDKVRVWENNANVNGDNGALVEATLKESDGTTLLKNGDALLGGTSKGSVSYTVDARVTATGTTTGATSVFTSTWNGSAWVWSQSVAYEAGTTSNHVRLYLSGGVPTVRLYSHAATYNVTYSVKASIGGYSAEAAIVIEQSARASADSAIATAATTLTARVTTAEGAITTNAASIVTEQTARASETGLLFAKYSVKIDTNGYVSGFGLASTANNATPTSAFIVRADSFSVSSPSGPGITPVTPFIVNTTPTTENGVSIPAGVYMDGAYIRNLTAAIVRMGDAWIDNADIANLSAAKLSVGDGTVGGNLKSTSFTSGSAGWLMQPSGSVEFNNATVRGTVYANAGLIGGNTIDSTGVESPNYTVNSYGWRLNSSGVFKAYADNGNYVIDMGATGVQPLIQYGTAFSVLADGTATFAGALSAASGTFAGALSGATGTFSGSLFAATGTFAGSLQAGVIDLSSFIGSTSTYEAGGPYTITVPADRTQMTITLIGGGGGGAASGTGYRAAGGGGLTTGVFTVTVGQTFTLYVGYGGASYTDGGATYISGLATAGGGQRGGSPTISGAGGTGTVPGYQGALPTPNGFSPAKGGNSGGNFGIGGTAANGGYPGGGGGNRTSFNPTGTTGGNGKAIIEFSNPNGVVLRTDFNTLTNALTRQGIAIT